MEAQEPRISSISIVEPLELAKILNQVTIFDARERGYSEGHIENSISMDWKDWTQEKPNFLKVAIFGDPSKWGLALVDSSVERRLQRLGVSNDKQIVVYGQPESWGQEGRIAWNFLLWGHKKVSLLNGGYKAWIEKKLPTTQDLPKLNSVGNFKVSLDRSRQIGFQDIKNILGSGKRRLILDARTQEEYEGKKFYGQKRGGRIPSSRLLPVSQLYQTDGRYISKENLLTILDDVTPDQPIAYCTGGVRSALLALLIEVRLGVITANYDASIWEWAKQSELPLETGKK